MRGAATISSSTTSSASRRMRPARVAGRRLGAGEGDQLGLRGAVEDRRDRRRLALLAGRAPRRAPPLTSLARTRVTMEMLVSSASQILSSVQPSPASACVGLEQDARLQDGLRRRLALRDQRVEPRPLIRGSSTTNFLLATNAPLSVVADKARISVRRRMQQLDLSGADH